MVRGGENRLSTSFALPDIPLKELKRKILGLWSSMAYIHFLDSHDFEDPYGHYDFLAAAAGTDVHRCTQLEELEDAFSRYPDWYFGHISYEYHRFLEPGLPPPRPGRLNYHPCLFYRPQWLIYKPRGEDRIYLEVEGQDPHQVWDRILEFPTPLISPSLNLDFQDGLGLDQYLERVRLIKEHIVLGDVYELNFCVQAMARGKWESPQDYFVMLGTRSPAPFSAYYQGEGKVMIGASPERYLCRREDRIYAQPIKGTAPRGKTPEEDHARRQGLKHSSKDQAENLMIVDLMRNDLCRFCLPGSVRVPELMGIHAFAQVFQMISTIEGIQSPESRLLDPIRYSFPMGSMTGAPKREVIRLIQEMEPVARELFSGTVGYIRPDGDFDFNVNIRSLFYDQGVGEWSYQTGGAITFDSDPLAEWEERRTKAWALESLFSSLSSRP